jgi:hypothetical protein
MMMRMRRKTMATMIQRLKIELFKIKERLSGKKKQPINAYATEIPGHRPNLSALPSLPGQAGFNQYSPELPGRRTPVSDLMNDPRFQQMQQNLARDYATMPPYTQPAPAVSPVVEKPAHWLWNVPEVIGDHLDWVYSKLPATKRKRLQKRDEEQRYEQFLRLAKGER